MSYTPDPAVVAAFDLIAAHRYSVLHACQATGCAERALRDYIKSQGVRLARGRGGGLATFNATARVMVMFLACAGRSDHDIAAVTGVHPATVYRWIHNSGMPVSRPPVTSTSNRDQPIVVSIDPVVVNYQPATVKVGRGMRLTAFDRVYIKFCLDQSYSIRQIGRQLGRHPSVISREITRNSLDGVYHPLIAQQRSIDAAKRPKARKLDANPVLRRMVIRLLNRQVSPKRIVARLKRLSGIHKELTVSHETIYQALYVQAAGALRHELTVDYALRSGRTGRRPRSKLPTRGRGAKPWVHGAEYSTRPPQAADRAVPGHWEGDLVLGAHGGKHAIITLIERHSRLFMARLLTTDHSSHTVVTALKDMLGQINQMATSPDHRVKTLTWDQGAEMATSSQLADHIEGLKMYFCDPHSPWQRPSNENINAELRRFIPKGTDLTTVTHKQLQEYEDLINDTPRVVLDGLTPREVFFNLDPSENVAFTA